MNLSFFSWLVAAPTAVPGAADENDIVGVVSKLKEGVTFCVTVGATLGVVFGVGFTVGVALLRT